MYLAGMSFQVAHTNSNLFSIHHTRKLVCVYITMLLQLSIYSPGADGRCLWTRYLLYSVNTILLPGFFKWTRRIAGYRNCNFHNCKPSQEGFGDLPKETACAQIIMIVLFKVGFEVQNRSLPFLTRTPCCFQI